MQQPDQTPTLHMDQGVMSSPGRRPRQNTPINLEEAADDALLSLRLSDLPLRLDATLMSRRIARLYRELTARNIIALPHVWLSEEFFTPDKTLGFAVPFYLAHPRLMRLERSQMLECEGASEAECRRILRHEAGHALDEAYCLHARPRYRQLFGNSGKPYPSSYSPRVDSRAHVVNLSGWYAQSHPVEDFAETFAVWLNPYVDWRTSYRTWPALAKLEYVDEVMREIANSVPPISSRAEVEPLASLGHTLTEHYTAKRAHFAWTWPANYDQDMRRIFSDDPKDVGAPLATRYLRRVRGLLRTRIAEGTGIHAYVIDQLLRQMIARAQSLGLRVIDPPDVTMEKLLVMLTMQTAGVLREGLPKVSL
jgi:Putative zinc-binding metallo-peptidase